MKLSWPKVAIVGYGLGGVGIAATPILTWYSVHPEPSIWFIVKGTSITLLGIEMVAAAIYIIREGWL